MASGKIKGITIEIGGDTTKLGKAIANTEAQTRSLQGELKQVEKLLKMDPGNTDLMAQKQQILTQAIRETTEKLNVLKNAEEQVIEQFNKGDIGEDQLRAFQREIIKTQSELDDFNSKLNGTAEEIEDVGESAEESGEGFTIMKGALADLVSNAIQGAISAIGNFVGSLMELSEATEEYRTMQAKLEGSANTFGYTIDFANEKYKEFYQYLGDDQASTNAITNLMGIGTSTESLSKLVDGASGAWTAYGDSINVESLTEAISETILCGKVTGSFADTINWTKDANENLKTALGGNVEATKAYNDAINEGLPVEDAFNEALAKITDSQERADVVAQFLNSTYGESKSTYDELNKSVMDTNNAELQLKETQAQLGETLAPVNDALTNMKSQALEAITPIVEKLADEFLNLLTWLKENPTAMTALTAVVITLTTSFTILAGVLAIQGLINGVSKAFAFLNTTMLANPIVLIVTLLAGLVAGFIYLWNNCEAFRQFWIDLWETLKTTASTIVQAIGDFFTVTIPNFFQSFIGWIKSNWANLLLILINPFAGLFKYFYENNTKFRDFVNNAIVEIKQLPGKAWTWFQNTINKVVSFATNLKTKAKDAGKKLVDNLIDKVKELPKKIMSVGTDTVKGLWNGISNSITWIKEKVGGFAKDILKSMKKALDINSPSKKAEKEIGEQIANGVVKGVDNKKANAKKSSTELANLYISAGKTKVSEMKKVNELSLANEVEFWEAMQNHCSQGTEAYEDATQQLKVAKENVNSEVEKLDKEYAEAVKKVKDEVTKEIQSITDAYNKAVEDRQKQILSSMKLFDAFKPEEAIGKEELTDNLESQVKALREWDNVLDELSNRDGMSLDLLNDLEEMGVGSVDTLKQINSMTDEELSAYIALYEEKKIIALERSKAEHEALKAESDAQITALIFFAEDKMNELAKTYIKEVTALGVDATKASKTVGVNIVRGIITGIDSQISALRAKMAELSAITISTAQTELDIHSPSRRFAEAVGKWIPEGIAKGILDNAGVASNAIHGVTDDLINGATLDRKLTTTFASGASVGGVDNSSLLDKLSGIYDRLGRLQIVLDTGTLVGETIDKIDSGLADRQLLYARGV